MVCRHRFLAGSGVLVEAEDLCRPLLHLPCRAGAPDRWRPLPIEGMGLGLSALNTAADGGGIVLRVYEPLGGRGEARMGLPDGSP